MTGLELLYYHVRGIPGSLARPVFYVPHKIERFVLILSLNSVDVSSCNVPGILGAN